MKKNEIVRLEITGLTQEGNGVGRFENMAVFVPFTAVGDVIDAKIVKVAKTYSYGITDKIITASADRIDSDCESFLKCGGCSFRHIDYNAELAAKQSFVEDAFKRIGKIECEVQAILGCENIDEYRNKAQYPVRQVGGVAICGFYSKRSHRITSQTKCALSPDVFSQIADDILKYINENKIRAYDEQSQSGILRHIYLRRGFNSGEIMVCLVCTKKTDFSPLSKILCEKYADIKTIVLNINADNTNVILGKKNIVIFGNGTIKDIMCGNEIELSPHSFYQINTEQAQKLYAIAEGFAEAGENSFVLDLYCGAGTIGLSMARRIKRLLGVEIVQSAVDNAIKNAERNRICNAEFICSDAGKAAQKICESNCFPDVVILDPPRKGCDSLTLESVVKMSPQRIVMVSCNPATCARDCAALEKMGYKTVKIKPVDMFPRTTHVECVVLMEKICDDLK
ncbi:MAG: 23S rRNA (uracil(1939)-C(5))-methyltransferase RlmD [Oscillospiraceae bacterium]|nr:23S rRNA (uracil(1939)-C(5))-methyltransferase RlmD [Oscillospiraceae bacterium]